MEMNKILIVLLGILLIVTIVQTFALNSLSTQVTAQGSKILQLEVTAQKLSTTGVSTVPSGTGSASPNIPSNLQNLPSMVGGC